MNLLRPLRLAVVTPDAGDARAVGADGHDVVVVILAARDPRVYVLTRTGREFIVEEERGIRGYLKGRRSVEFAIDPVARDGAGARVRESETRRDSWSGKKEKKRPQGVC